MKLALADAAYPRALRQLQNPPPILTTSGSLSTHRRAVAIVGSREACDESLAFAHDLAFQLGTAGVVVVSGGAVGVDGAAHRGALASGGVTWVVSPTGMGRVYPPRHAELFAKIASSEESRMIWPFDDAVGATKSNFLYRNGVLAALSETLVVIQAHRKSGSRNACAWARDLGRPVWAMTSAPWMTSFGGTADEIELRGARPLCSATQLLLALGLEQRRPPRRPRPAAEARQLPLEPRKPGRARPSSRIPETPPEPPSAEPWTADESLVFSKVSKRAQHVDQIVDATGLQVPSVATALLTLSLKDVVVEGPDGFFRRT